MKGLKMSTRITAEVTVEADQSALRRDGDHITMILPVQLAEALKVAAEIMAMSLLDPEVHAEGDKQRMAIAIEESINLVNFANGLGSVIKNQEKGSHF